MNKQIQELRERFNTKKIFCDDQNRLLTPMEIIELSKILKEERKDDKYAAGDNMIVELSKGKCFITLLENV